MNFFYAKINLPFRSGIGQPDSLFMNKKCNHTKTQRMMNENEIGEIIIDAAVAVHKELGPGLLENVYETILACEVKRRG